MGKVQKFGISFALALSAILLTAIPVLAITLPDSTPTVESIHIYRNVLQTGDFEAIIYENTPYATPPTVLYSEAFIWRLIDTDGTTELAQSLGSSYHADGYGYNVISFYLNAANVTSKGITWGDNLTIRLSGTPTAFATPPVYNFPVPSSSYSGLTLTTAVKSEIASQIISIANNLYSRWSLTSANTLVDSGGAIEVLTPNGQDFFRQAIYGVQAMAPSVFNLNITSTTGVGYVPAAGGNVYSNNLSGQNVGNPLGNAESAGKTMLGVGYNLFGLILVIGMIAIIIGGNWAVAGGMSWRGLIESAGPMVISGRIGLIGLGELGLICALCWLYISAKMWRMI